MPPMQEQRCWNPLALLIVLLAASALVYVPVAGAAGDWNDRGIAWESYEEGLKKAKAEKKPICLVFYTTWCPHCTNYAKVFHDSTVVEMAKKFVMIRLDKDRNPALSSKYAPDGQYIPRTYFLSASGELDPELHAPREKFKYFYDEENPASLLVGFEAALKKLN